MSARSIIVIGAMWVTFLIISISLVSSLNFNEYNLENSGSKDRLFTPIRNIKESNSEIQSIVNLSSPTLFHDGDNISIPFPKGKYYIDHVSDTKYRIRLLNESENILYYANSNTESEYCSLGGGTITILEDMNCYIQFEGNSIIIIGNFSIRKALAQSNEYHGNSLTSPLTFTFSPSDPVNNQIDHTVLYVTIRNSIFNITVYDHFFNTIVKKTLVSDSVTLKFDDYQSIRNFVLIESSGNNSEINIMHKTEFYSQKSYEYVNISIIVFLAVICSGITLRRKYK